MPAGFDGAVAMEQLTFAELEHVPVRETALWLWQGEVPGFGEEHAADRGAAWVHESAGRRSVCGGLTWGWCARGPRKGDGNLHFGPIFGR